MTEDPRELLKSELEDLGRMKAHLSVSLEKSLAFGEAPTAEQLTSEATEAFTSRFARTADMLVNKVLRTLDRTELEPAGSLLDVIQRAEKRGIIESAADLRLVKNLRNSIAHDYAGEQMLETVQLCRKWSPALLEAITRLQEYADRTLGIRSAE